MAEDACGVELSTIDRGQIAELVEGIITNKMIACNTYNIISTLIEMGMITNSRVNTEV